MGREQSRGRKRTGRGPELEHCGIDLDRFERLVDQNNYGELAYPHEAEDEDEDEE